MRSEHDMPIRKAEQPNSREAPEIVETPKEKAGIPTEILEKTAEQEKAHELHRIYERLSETKLDETEKQQIDALIQRINTPSGQNHEIRNLLNSWYISGSRIEPETEAAINATGMPTEKPKHAPDFLAVLSSRAVDELRQHITEQDEGEPQMRALKALADASTDFGAMLDATSEYNPEASTHFLSNLLEMINEALENMPPEKIFQAINTDFRSIGQLLQKMVGTLNGMLLLDGNVPPELKKATAMTLHLLDTYEEVAVPEYEKAREGDWYAQQKIPRLFIKKDDLVDGMASGMATRYNETRAYGIPQRERDARIQSAQDALMEDQSLKPLNREKPKESDDSITF